MLRTFASHLACPHAGWEAHFRDGEQAGSDLLLLGTGALRRPRRVERRNKTLDKSEASPSAGSPDHRDRGARGRRSATTLPGACDSCVANRWISDNVRAVSQLNRS